MNRQTRYRLIGIVGILCATCIMMITLIPNSALTPYFIMALYTLGLYLFYHSWKSAIKEKGVANLGFILTGVLAVVGGAIFDVSSTVIHSPDLTYESNPIVIALFESGFTIPQIYLLGLLGQLLFCAIILALWVAFLKAFFDLASHVNKNQSMLNFIKEFHGGPNVTWPQFLLGKVEPRRYVLSAIPFLVCMSSVRWYLGLEWFGVVPVSRIIMPVIMFLSSVIAVIMIERLIILRTASDL